MKSLTVPLILFISILVNCQGKSGGGGGGEEDSKTQGDQTDGIDSLNYYSIISTISSDNPNCTDYLNYPKDHFEQLQNKPDFQSSNMAIREELCPTKIGDAIGLGGCKIVTNDPNIGSNIIYITWFYQNPNATYAVSTTETVKQGCNSQTSSQYLSANDQKSHIANPQNTVSTSNPTTDISTSTSATNNTTAETTGTSETTGTTNNTYTNNSTIDNTTTSTTDNSSDKVSYCLIEKSQSDNPNATYYENQDRKVYEMTKSAYTNSGSYTSVAEGLCPKSIGDALSLGGCQTTSSLTSATSTVWYYQNPNADYIIFTEENVKETCSLSGYSYVYGP